MILTVEPPELDARRWSANMRDFVKVCLTKDPKQRPSAEQLIQHPFLLDPESIALGREQLASVIEKYQEH